MVRITEADAAWIRNFYPSLRMSSDHALSGHLRFRAVCQRKSNKEIQIFHDSKCNQNYASEGFIEDVYEVNVIVVENDPMPRVWEIGGRLKSQTESMGKSLADLHMYEDESLCLGNPVKIRADMAANGSIQNYLEQWLIPYLYYRSYLEKFGCEPWPGLPHGQIGILEDFADSVEIDIDVDTLKIFSDCYPDLFRQISASRSSKEGCRPNDECICGSGAKFMRCHPKALLGYKNLRKSFLKT